MDWKNLLGTVAPWIGTALGGPLGGMAATAIAEVFGLSEKTEEAMKQALSGATPEQMLALKAADQQFALRMQELGFQNVQALEKIAADDRDSARKREMTVMDWTPRILASAITIGFFIVLSVMMRNELPKEGRDALLIMLGALGTSWTSVIAYYFGSTAGSARKTELLGKSSPVEK